MAEDARTATIWGALCEHMMHCHCVSVSDSDMAEDARTAAIWSALCEHMLHCHCVCLCQTVPWQMMHARLRSGVRCVSI